MGAATLCELAQCEVQEPRCFFIGSRTQSLLSRGGFAVGKRYPRAWLPAPEAGPPQSVEGEDDAGGEGCDSCREHDQALLRSIVLFHVSAGPVAPFVGLTFKGRCSDRPARFASAGPFIRLTARGSARWRDFIGRRRRAFLRNVFHFEVRRHGRVGMIGGRGNRVISREIEDPAGLDEVWVRERATIGLGTSLVRLVDLGPPVRIVEVLIC